MKENPQIAWRAVFVGLWHTKAPFHLGAFLVMRPEVLVLGLYFGWLALGIRLDREFLAEGMSRE